MTRRYVFCPPSLLNVDIAAAEEDELSAFDTLQVSRLVSVRTQIEHAIRKIENSTVLASKVRKDEDRQQATVDELKKNLEQVEKLAQEAEREQERLSRKKGQALSERDLAEYRQLCVFPLCGFASSLRLATDPYPLPSSTSRAKANTLLPDERSSLDSLRRREKTLRQEIEAAEEKEDVLRRKVARLESEISNLETRKDIVRRPPPPPPPPPFHAEVYCTDARLLDLSTV